MSSDVIRNQGNSRDRFLTLHLETTVARRQDYRLLGLLALTVRGVDFRSIAFSEATGFQYTASTKRDL